MPAGVTSQILCAQSHSLLPTLARRLRFPWKRIEAGMFYSWQIDEDVKGRGKEERQTGTSQTLEGSWCWLPSIRAESCRGSVCMATRRLPGRMVLLDDFALAVEKEVTGT